MPLDKMAAIAFGGRIPSTNQLLYLSRRMEPIGQAHPVTNRQLNESFLNLACATALIRRPFSTLLAEPSTSARSVWRMRYQGGWFYSLECWTRQATLLQYAESADRGIGRGHGAVAREAAKARNETSVSAEEARFFRLVNHPSALLVTRRSVRSWCPFWCPLIQSMRHQPLSFFLRYSEGRQPIHLVKALENTKGLW